MHFPYDKNQIVSFSTISVGKPQVLTINSVHRVWILTLLVTWVEAQKLIISG